MKLSDLTDEDLVNFFVQARSVYKVKTYLVNNNEVTIRDVAEIEDEMINRSTKYWNSQIEKLQKRLAKGS